MLVAIYKLKQLIESGRLEVEIERGEPLCMAQYRKLFAATRIPEEGCDSQKNICFVDDITSLKYRHIVVFSRGQPYSLELVAANGQPRSHDVVAHALMVIKKEGTISEPENAI